MTTELSDPIRSQAVISGASSAVRTGANGTASDSARPPPTALTPIRNDRRLKSSPDVIANPSAPPPYRGEGAPNKVPRLGHVAARQRTRHGNKGGGGGQRPICAFPLFTMRILLTPGHSAPEHPQQKS